MFSLFGEAVYTLFTLAPLVRAHLKHSLLVKHQLQKDEKINRLSVSSGKSNKYSRKLPFSF